MVLKEAFRMQNHLTALTDEAIAFLSINENVMRIKEEHQRSKRNPKAEDETVEVKRDHEMTAKELAGKKSSETQERGMDYLINAEGNQTAYYYNVRSTRTIDYDREVVRGIVKRLQRESDEVSTKIDVLNVTLDVDYAPKYDFESGFEDAYEQFVKTK